ncbi:MAG TPA: glycosyltransferase family 4 protein [Desulfuromonadaceae bacterium]|nr:glycosyltransferase family 4 protein [Desulfuromonadaceae bacterium]
MSLSVAIITTDKREHDRNYTESAPSFGTAPEALFQGFAHLPGIEIHVISCTQQPVSALPRLAHNIWFHNLHVPKIGWMRTFYQGCIRATRRKLKEIHPDIVHGQGTERDCALDAVLSGFPNILTIHGNMTAVAEFYRSRIGSFYWLAGKLETFALSKTIGVFCNSSYTESRVRPRARKIWRVPNAVRLPFFQSTPGRPKNERAVLLNLGVLSPYKRQSEVLAMATRLWQRGLRFEIRFAGTIQPDSAYDRDFLKQLKEAETAGYARHLGSLPIEQLIAAMDDADALVHCPEEESFGLVVAEALARNLKLFGMSVGGVVDIADGVDQAELFPRNNFTAMENAIARWIENGYPRPGQAAAIMEMRYHPDVIARRHLEIYREVLNKR